MGGRSLLDEKLSSFAATSAVFVAVCAVNVPSPLYPTYQHIYHLSATVLTAIFATFAVGVLAALVLVGPLSDHIGRKPVLIAGEAVLILSEALFLGAHGAAWLFAARAAQGFALGTISSAASAALAELNRANLNRAALMNTMAFTVAGTISCVGTGLLAQYLPWRTTLCFIVLLAANLVSLGAVALMGEPLATRPNRPYRMRLPGIPRNILGPVLVACGAMAVGWTLGGVYGSLSPSIVDLLLKGDGLVISGAVLSVFNLVGGVCQYFARRHAPHRVMLAAVAATMIGAVAVNLSLDAKSLALFFVATVFAGIGAALVFVGSLALVNRLAPARVASRDRHRVFNERLSRARRLDSGARDPRHPCRASLGDRRVHTDSRHRRRALPLFHRANETVFCIRAARGRRRSSRRGRSRPSPRRLSRGLARESSTTDQTRGARRRLGSQPWKRRTSEK